MSQPFPAYLPYGSPITLAEARAVAAAAETTALEHGWPVVVAIVDPGGHLVLLQRLDGTQTASVDVARVKAQSAVAFRRPTKVWEEAVGANPSGPRILGLPGAVPIEGGLPLVRDGHIIGAIGVSGVTSREDGVIAAAGAAGLDERHG